MIEADRYLEDVTGRYAALYAAAVGDMVVAMARNNRAAMQDARDALERVITDTMGRGEILGAMLTLRKAAAVLGPEAMAADRGQLLAFAGSAILPRVTFNEALQDMVDRTPAVIRDAAERMAETIAKLYGEGRVVAFAKSAEAAVTERVQALMAHAIEHGIGEAEAGGIIKLGVDQIRAETGPWTESYARMAFRTNVNTAVTAGRFRQAQDPEVMRAIPCFRFDAVGDADTRDNHEAANGLIFSVTNRVWNRIAPPLGYNCRCQVSYVGMPELRRMGRVDSNGNILEDVLPAGAFPDPGFRHGGRPDLFMVAT